jgi:hypothetical protein
MREARLVTHCQRLFTFFMRFVEATHLTFHSQDVSL